MKKRNGFVSNSSSSSFVIKTKDLTGEQIEKINNHIDHWNQTTKILPDHYEADEKWAWDIELNDEFMVGSVFMNNFSMKRFLEHIGVNDEDIEWDRNFL